MQYRFIALAFFLTQVLDNDKIYTNMKDGVRMNAYKNHMSKEDAILSQWSDMVMNADRVEPHLYGKYEVKKGLRDASGRGVLAGLTRIGEVHSYIIDEGEKISVPGRLIYRGYDIEKLVQGSIEGGYYGFEETAYLLMFGELPTRTQLNEFNELLGTYRELPTDFTTDMIMKAPTKDMMNSLARSVLALYSFDEDADSVEINHVIKQSIDLIAKFPTLMVYGYQSYRHFYRNESLILHAPQPRLSTAENILYMLRDDHKYTELEAQILDMALILHAEHGGGNNSSFTTHVVTSSGTDTYSTIAAALGSLKGPRHGGANIKVVEMFNDLKTNISDWTDESAIATYLNALMNKEAFDKSGLIYGIGHAVYTLSDPRAVVFKGYVEKLAKEKGLTDEYLLFDTVERLAPAIVSAHRGLNKDISANVDFYSGFVYRMLKIPEELYTPIFAVSRITGWCAHRIEELVNNGKIIRPAYKSVAGRREHITIDNR